MTTRRRGIPQTLRRIGENPQVSEIAPFAEVAGDSEATLDVVALALAGEFRDVDVPGAMASLDALGAELSRAAEQTSRAPEAEVIACRQVLGDAHGFLGDQAQYDHPDNSMLDLVLARRRGLPILLSVVYVEVARRAGIDLAGVGLPGHFVVGHFGAVPPVLLDPFIGGATVTTAAAGELIRAWNAHEIAMRMLNNLIAAYQRRGDLTSALHAATMRLALPVSEPELHDVLKAELRAIQARLN
jgi:regulator of sirC expression with transglutaminase-like and TPR domain